MTGRILALSLAMLAAGCSSSDAPPPLDVSGVYSGPVVNGTSSCPGLWNTGQTSDVQINAAQSGSNISLQLQGGAGLFVRLLLGADSFNGTVSGAHIDAILIGSTQTTMMGCVYSWTGNLSADLNGNTLTGQIQYTPQTNGNADCTTQNITGCARQQTFTLTRPPK
jgi:hypothetical protein